MKGRLTLVGLLALCGASAMAIPESQQGSPDTTLLRQRFDLASERSPEVQYYTMESRMVTRGPDGTPVSTDIYRLSLRCVPAEVGRTDGDRYTCLRFTVQLGNGRETAIPSLAGWSYLFKPGPEGVDASGRTLGIPHEPFADLRDASGSAIPPGNAYHVYNAFIDFHSFFVFTERTASAGGIQDLTRIGQRILHSASHSQPATNLGEAFAPGSFFKNGEITLELKGIGLENDRPCAIVGYDSGASSFVMIATPAPNLQARTAGSSHYWGDIYKDLTTGWVQRASLTELVVSETTLPVPPGKVDGIAERSILVRNVPEASVK